MSSPSPPPPSSSPPQPPRPPPIPLQMAGGRPQPANTLLLLRPGTPSSSPAAPPAAAALAPSALPAAAAAPAVLPAAFEFTFESGLRRGTIAPPGTPVPVSAARRRRLLPSAGPMAGEAGLYGQAWLVESRLHYQTTDRMDEWLGRLQALSLERQHEEDKEEQEQEQAVSAAAAVVVAAAPVTTDMTAASGGDESARIGNKRSAPTDDDDVGSPGNDNHDQPTIKRSRVGSIIQRAVFSRMSNRRAATPSTANTTAVPTSTTNTRKTKNKTTKKTKRTPLAGLFGTGGGDNNNPAGNAPTPSSPGAAPPAAHRAFSPFGMAEGVFSSREGSTVAATAGSVASTSVVSRTIKVCLVGDVASGKTAFFNRLTHDTFIPTASSIVPDCKTVGVRIQDDSIVNVELWDFPGIVSGERAGPLLSTFFHAAIICFNLEDKEHTKNVSEVWKPKLNASLHDRDVFVLGLKRDLRPSFQPLGLSFLPTQEPVTTEMGWEVAEKVNANGYGECSAKTNDNVRAAWEGIINYIVSGIEEHERAVRHDRRRDRAKAAIVGAFSKCALRRFGRSGEE